MTDSKPLSQTTDDLLWRLKVLADRPTRGKFWPDETLRDAAREIERLREDVAMWQRAYTEASVRYHQMLDKETLT